MDEKDLKILKAIKKNARISLRKISEKTGIKLTSVFNRIKRMERGLIRGYTVDMDVKNLGLGVTAYVLVSYKRSAKTQQEIVKKLSTYPQISEASVITGDWDMLLKVVEKDVEALGKFITMVLREMPEISKTNTLVVFHTEKNENFLDMVAHGQ
jgi:Lrp/AsnC family leucine-responsive transcriptional regulator